MYSHLLDAISSMINTVANDKCILRELQIAIFSVCFLLCEIAQLTYRYFGLLKGDS